MPTSSHSKQSLIGNFEKQSHVLCTSLFVSQVFKTTSNALNFDVNIVNIALIAFLLAGGDKVGSLADVEFTLV